MTQYIGLDVSLKETKLHVLDEAGNRIWRGLCATDPTAIAAAVRRYAPMAARIGLETGPLTTWLWTPLTAEGLPMVCLDARHDRGDNPDPGIGQSTCSNTILDERCAIRHRTQFGCLRRRINRASTFLR
jgi:hypothetical protein